MKKNLILMTALFAGSMIVNDGVCAKGSKYRYKSYIKVVDPTAQPNQMSEVAKPTPSGHQDEELPADREQIEQEQVRRLQTQLTKTQDKLDTTQQELENAKTAKKELEDKVNELEKLNAEIQAQLSEKENDLEKLTTSEKEFQGLKTQLEEQGAALKKAQSQLKEKENELCTLQSEKQALESQSTTLATQLRELKKSYSGLEDERTTLAAQVKLITKQLPQINSLLKNVLGKSVTTGDLLTNITDDELGRQIAILNAYVHALQKLHTDDGTKKAMSKEEQKSIDKFIEDLHDLNENVVIYTQEQPQKNDKKGIDGICFEIGQLHTNIAKLLKLYQNLSDKYSQITAQAFVEVKKEPPHPADETQRKHEEFAAQNKKSYWIPGWVKTIGVGVGLVATVLAKQYQNYSVTVPATPGTNSLGNAAHDVIWDRDTGSMLYLNGTKYQLGELDIERLNATYPEEFKLYFNEPQISHESQCTSWFSWWQTDNKPNEGELCNDYYEEGIKNGTATMQEELKKLQTQNSELNTNNTALERQLETAEAEKTAAEQAKKEAKDDLEKCKAEKDQLNDNAFFLTQQLDKCTNDKTKAEEKLKQYEAEKANIYTKEEYDAHYNDGIKEGEDEKKSPNTGSKISEEDKEIVRRYKDRNTKVKQLQEELRATSNFNVLKSFILIVKIIKVRFFDL